MIYDESGAKQISENVKNCRRRRLERNIWQQIVVPSLVGNAAAHCWELNWSVKQQMQYIAKYERGEKVGGAVSGTPPNAFFCTLSICSLVKCNKWESHNKQACNALEYNAYISCFPVAFRIAVSKYRLVCSWDSQMHWGQVMDWEVLWHNFPMYTLFEIHNSNCSTYNWPIKRL